MILTVMAAYFLTLALFKSDETLKTLIWKQRCVNEKPHAQLDSDKT